MGQFGKWLLREEQKELFDYLFAIVLNAVFLVLVALVLWPLGRAGMAWRFTKAYWMFWAAVIVVASLVAGAHRIFRMDLDSHGNAYVITGLVTGGFLQVGWAAYAAPIVHDAVVGAPVWVALVLYVISLVSCWVASVIVAAFYLGTLYRMVNLALALASFIVFSIWPTAISCLF